MYMLWIVRLFIKQVTFFFIITTVVEALSSSSNKQNKLPTFRVGVIGGGASGVFAAAACADALNNNDDGRKRRQHEVVVLEGGVNTMTKVKVSGGGRCNVLHDTSKSVPVILNGYPRGKKELNGIMNKYFSPTQAEEWFTKRGVVLKTEKDGRMFPITDDSQTIINTIMDDAERNGVIIRTKEKVISVEKKSIENNNNDDEDETKFVVHVKRSKESELLEVYDFDCLILATGSSPTGHDFAKSLGHKIISPVPSLFTLNAKLQVKEGGVFHGLSGLSVQDVKISFKYSVPGKKKKKEISQEGPILITHHGLSGPAALRLSAFAAREFNGINYRGDVLVHWAPEFGSAENIEKILWQLTMTAPKRVVSTVCPLTLSDGSTAIPKRLWAAIVIESGFEQTTVWGEAPKKKVRVLSQMISNFVVDMTGKGTFKDEFVTAGGVSLKEIVMKTMESKKCPSLYLCGEVIDVDGVTGGFNFMNCWSTGYMAGTSAASSILNKQNRLLI